MGGLASQVLCVIWMGGPVNYVYDGWEGQLKTVCYQDGWAASLVVSMMSEKPVDSHVYGGWEGQSRI